MPVTKKVAKSNPNDWIALPTAAVREHAYRSRNPKLNHAVLHAPRVQADRSLTRNERLANYEAQNLAAGHPLKRTSSNSTGLTTAQVRQLRRMSTRQLAREAKADA